MIGSRPDWSPIKSGIGMVSLEFGAKRYNIAVEPVQKETASLFKRDCRARATHPGAVDYIVVKQLRLGK